MTSMKSEKKFNMPTNSLDHLVNLTELDLSNNEMDTFDTKVLFNLPKLKTFDLSNNQLVITPSMLVDLKELKNLTLSGFQVAINDVESLGKIYNLTIR